MKKFFIFAVLLLVNTFIFADTGYKGIQWKSSIEQVKERISLETEPVEVVLSKIPGFEFDTNQSYCITANILGKISTVSYFFVNKELTSICYEIDRKDLKTLLKKYNTKPIIYHSSKCTDLKSMVETESGNLFDILNPENEAEINNVIYSYFLKCFMQFASINMENQMFKNIVLDWYGLTQEKIKKPAGTLYIYDYNSDTRVYIYDNIIKDKAVVVYVPHEQDY